MHEHRWIRREHRTHYAPFMQFGGRTVVWYVSFSCPCGAVGYRVPA